MKSAILLMLLGSVAFAFHEPDARNIPDGPATTAAKKSETLADAVTRINKEVQRDFGVLSPKPITASALKRAIESAADEVAESDIPGRASYVNTLTQIAATSHIPDSVRFCFTPITGSYSEQQRSESRDGRHVAISLNYTLLMPSDQGNRLIGLTQIVEVFQVIKPQEQRVPFQPPPQPAQK